MDKKGRTGYRVCRRRGESYVSTYMGRRTTTGWKIYAIGRITRRAPGYGALAVFKYADDARQFMEHNDMYVDGYALFRCKYLVSEDAELWRRALSGRRIYCGCKITGTCFADAVELIEEIDIGA